MVETLLGAMAFLVFGALWLSTQPWFDLLPRRTTRRISAVALGVLLVTAYAAPNALQVGVSRWIDYATAKAVAKYEGFVRDAFDELGSRPPAVPAPPTS